jgi:hypothetical protein
VNEALLCLDIGNARDKLRAEVIRAELGRLRAEVEALALLLGECADELETEIHCRLSGDKATLRLGLPHRAKKKLRELGLLTPNSSFSGC